MIRCRLRFFQRLICLIIIVTGAALLLIHRYYELGALQSSRIFQILNKDVDTSKLTSSKPPGSPIVKPMIVYKKKMIQSAASNETKKLSITSAWRVWRTWPHSKELFSEKQFYSNEMASILHHMATAPIVRFDVGYRGTQLKALVELDGGQLAVFKPKRYILSADNNCN